MSDRYTSNTRKAQQCLKAGELNEAIRIYWSEAEEVLQNGYQNPKDRLNQLYFLSRQLLYVCQAYDEASTVLEFLAMLLEGSELYGPGHPTTIEVYLDLFECYMELNVHDHLLSKVVVFLQGTNFEIFLQAQQEDSRYENLDVMDRLTSVISTLSGNGYERECSAAMASFGLDWPILKQAGERLRSDSNYSAGHEPRSVSLEKAIGTKPGGSLRKDTQQRRAISKNEHSNSSSLSQTSRLRTIAPSRPSPELNKVQAYTKTNRTDGSDRWKQRIESVPSSTYRAVRTEEPYNAASVPSATSQASAWEAATSFGGSEKGIAGLADRWFTDVATWCYPIVTDIDCAATNNTSYERVRVAVLDTGLALKEDSQPDLVRKHLRRIKGYKSFVESEQATVDTDGHGTHVAMLTLQTFPNADVYIGKVSTDSKTFTKSAVVAALKWAIGIPVKIVNMSFGWPNVDFGELRDVLAEAKRKDILLFAATSNHGLRYESGIAYPASSADVIGIDCATGAGTSSDDMNPPSNSMNSMNSWRFTAPGEGVLSAYPITLEQSGLKRLDGTSFATGIATGIAAMVLEFARQPPLNFEPKIEELLSSREVMLWVLHDLLSEKQNDQRPFRFLMPWKLFKGERDEDDDIMGGEATVAGSPRLRAAEKIVECIELRFQAGVGKEFYAKLNAART